VRILPAYLSIAAWSFSALAILYAFQAFFSAPQVCPTEYPWLSANLIRLGRPFSDSKWFVAVEVRDLLLQILSVSDFCFAKLFPTHALAPALRSNRSSLEFYCKFGLSLFELEIRQNPSNEDCRVFSIERPARINSLAGSTFPFLWSDSTAVGGSQKIYDPYIAHRHPNSQP
jgi:hypothetical protein